MGFVADKQALRGSLSDPGASAPELYELLAGKVGQRERLQSSIIAAFLTSADFDQARDRFNRMQRVVQRLTDEQFRQIVSGYGSNDQLNQSFYLNNKYQRLVTFLQKTTAHRVSIDQNKIIVSEADNDTPF